MTLEMMQRELKMRIKQVVLTRNHVGTNSLHPASVTGLHAYMVSKRALVCMRMRIWKTKVPLMGMEMTTRWTSTTKASARDSHTKVSPVQREGDVDRPSVLPSNRTSTEPNPADDADPEVPNQGYLSHNLRDALVDDGHRVADEERARDEGPTPVDASAPPSPSSPTSPQHVRPSFAPSPTADDTYLEPEPLDDDRAQDEFIHEPEPEPIEDIDIDEDPDLQPAHRAEALDVLATIELKFALLRESVYIEKMEGLAWEEALVWEGTHPELQHLHAELTKRRDKRLTLAAKKRIHEVKAAERRRREEERREWEEWQIARNELQTEMIAETNRKRRKLERERRTAERPVGVRRIPNPILNPPPAPTLRQIANMFPLPSYLSHIATVSRSSALHGFGITPSHALGLGMGFGAVGSGPTTYPDLPTLLPHEIVSDLDFLFQHRRAGFGGIGFGYGYGMGFGPGVGTGMGGGNLGLHGGLGSFNGGASGPGMVFGPTPGMGLGMNDLAVGPTSGADVYPPNPNHTATGSGVNATIGGTTTLPSQIPVSGGPQQTPLSVHAAVGSVIGPGIGPPPPINADAPMDFHQPPVGIFHSASGPIAPGPGSSNGHALGATAGSGQGGSSGGRIRPSGFALDREGEPRDRDRELVQHDRENDRDFALRDREREPRDRVIVQRERGYGPGYSGWGGKPGGTVDWGAGEGRRREDDVDRDRERDRVGERAGDRAERERDKDRNDRERGNRDKAQAEPIVPTPTHRYSHQHSQHSTHSQHAQHSHQHTQHQYSAHAPPHHHIGQHHHHRHHHHVVHHHHLSGSTHGATGDGRDGSVAGLGVSQGQGQVQTMEIINLSANPASKAHWKREEGKLGGSVSNSRPPSTHPPPNTFAYDEREREREREREQERDRPVAMPFVLGPSHNSITSAASSPRHGWTSAHGDGNGPSGAGRHSPSFLPPLEFHSPVPAGPGSHRFSNANGVSVQLTRPPTSPPRGSAVPSATATLTSPSISNLSAPSTTPNGPFPLQRKPSPALPKLGVNSLLFSPRLAGPGIVPPTGPGVPGVPGVLCGPAAGPGVPPPPTGPGIPSAGPIAGILTSGPGIPPGPGVAPMPTSMPTSVVGHGIPPPTATSGLGIPPTAPGEAMCSGNRTASPLIPYTPPRSGAPTTQKVGVDVDGP
ncbi:Sds3-like-domain-containing protein [Phlebopus sp. FC_14]|nr:Sds3-like-domain-containing protein [Phlebopus sp. FC_14]